MTAGHGIVHSECRPSALGPGASGHPDLARAARGERRKWPRLSMSARLTCRSSRTGRLGVIMGELWGQAPTTTCFQTIYADIELAEGGVVLIDPAATERAVYLAYGDAMNDGIEMEVSTSTSCARASLRILRLAGGGCIVSLCARDSPRLAMSGWSLVSSRDRINQAMKTGRQAISKVPGRRQGPSRSPEVPKR